MATQTQVQVTGLSGANSDDSGVELVITLVIAVGTGIVFLSLFTLFRFLNRKGKCHHAYRQPSKLQNPKVEHGRHRTCLGLTKALLRFSDIDIARDVSFDAYLLLRYIKLGILICFIGCLLTWTVLFPVSATSTGGSSELRIISDQLVESTRRIFDVGALEGKVKRRDKLATQLEALETSLIRRENSERSTIVPKPPKVFNTREEIRVLNSAIQLLQTRYLAARTEDPTAVLIKFKTPSDIQDLAHYELLKSASIAHIGLEPQHIIWSNLNTNKKMRVFRLVTSVAVLGLFWLALFVPLFFFALLEDESTPFFYPSFQFLNSQPPGIAPLITGVIPVVYVSLATDILAMACQYAARSSGLPTQASVEMRTQKLHLPLLVGLVLVGQTIVPASIRILPSAVKDTSSIAIIIAEQLARAADFLFQFVILDSIGHSSAYLLTSESYIGPRVKSLFHNTPRKIRNLQLNRHNLRCGHTFPEIAIFAVAAITYSCVAPLLLGFACAGLYLYYLAYRYQIRNLPMDIVNTHGQTYHLALQQTLVGCYTLTILLIVLFTLAVDGDYKRMGPVWLLLILLILCVAYHSMLNDALKVFQDRPNEDKILQAQFRKTRNPLTKLFSRQLSVIAKSSPDVFPKEDCDMISSQRGEWHMYFHSSVNARVPEIWVPRDSRGSSNREIQETARFGIPMANEGAWLDGRNNIHLDEEDRLPF
ncbi:hypothetical protein ACN38_g7128 [Penicillium nordicum]|uniref:CSC1/OSCA1-like 7TM region domain-containing protein n=1 Tax=Penicillium nordicum TaxID=229535 RepID=A0A0M9WEV4_9EURO|nr:hypothetical protein ACN38_g7128 [Penicillium nordicum]